MPDAPSGNHSRWFDYFHPHYRRARGAARARSRGRLPRLRCYAALVAELPRPPLRRLPASVGRNESGGVKIERTFPDAHESLRDEDGETVWIEPLCHAYKAA